MNVNGKVIVVTGGGNGVGRELVLQLLEKGAYVAAVDINQEGLDETRKLTKNNKRLSTHVVNIANRSEVESLVPEVISRHGAVDGVINNAGIIQPFTKLNDLPFETIERVMNVNYYGTLYMTKAFLPELLKRPDAHLLNIASMGGFLPVPGQSIYGASKAAIKLLTESLISELADTNVKVSVVIPGAMATNIKKNSNLEVNEEEDHKKASKILTADRSATLIIKAIETDKKRLYLGKDSRIMNILYRLNSNFASSMINKVMQANGH